MKRGLFLATAIIASCIVSSATAAIPGTTLLEGVLTSSGGGAAADGDYKIEFAVYDAKTGGNEVWAETATIKVKNGRFSHALGAIKPIDAAKISAKKGWLQLKIGADPALARQQLHSAIFAMTAGSVACSGCINAASVANGSIGATKVSFAYAKAADGIKGGAAADLKCTGCVSATTEVAWDGDLDFKDKTLTAAKVTSGSDVIAKGTMAAKEFVGDGSKLTGIQSVSGECKNAGEVVKGIKADGSLICVKAMDPNALPKDGISNISNGQLSNQFIDTIKGGSGKDIPDNNPDGLLDVIKFPDIGIAQQIEVTIDITNSDTGDVAVFLFPPNAPKLPTSRQTLFKGYPIKPEIKDPKAYPHYVLSLKKQFDPKNKTIIKGTFPTKNKEVSGSIHGDWLNKNIKGEWRLLVMDTAFLNNKTDGKLNGWEIKIQTLSNKQINVTGTSFNGGTVWGKYNGSGQPGGDLQVGGGLKIGNTATKCDATSVGTMRQSPTHGTQVCQKNWDGSKVIGYVWAQHRSAPIVWSGGCKSHARSSGGWVKYCLNGTDFNNANDYISVASGGDVTIKKSGYYRVNAWAINHGGSAHRHLQWIINGTSRYYNHHYWNGHQWHTLYMNQIWPFDANDKFYVQYHVNNANNRYQYHSWNANGQHSRMQIEYVGPLAK